LIRAHFLAEESIGNAISNVKKIKATTQKFKTQDTNCVAHGGFCGKSVSHNMENARYLSAVCFQIFDDNLERGLGVGKRNLAGADSKMAATAVAQH